MRGLIGALLTDSGSGKGFIDASFPLRYGQLQEALNNKNVDGTGNKR
jgi:hypothetical protein